MHKCNNCKRTCFCDRETIMLSQPDDCECKCDMAQIRYSKDGAVCIVQENGNFRVATQSDMDTLPIGADLSLEEIDMLDS